MKRIIGYLLIFFVMGLYILNLAGVAFGWYGKELSDIWNAFAILLGMFAATALIILTGRKLLKW